MEYKKIVKDKYNIHIINTDRFKTITVGIAFRRKLVKEEITIRNLLKDLMINANGTYPTERDLIIETEKLYDLKLSSSNYRIGNDTIIAFRMRFLNEKYTEDGMNEESIRFLYDLIFNPKFDSDFDKCKNRMKKSILSLKDNKIRYSLLKLLETTKDKPYSYNSYGEIEVLDKISVDDVKNYYDDVIKNDIVDVFVVGEVNNDKIKNLFRECFKLPTYHKYKSDIIVPELISNGSIKEYREKDNVNQTQISILCKLSKLTDRERKYVLPVYSEMLGGTANSLLFDNVREKNSYAYYVNAIIKSYDNILIIYSGVGAGNEDNVIKIIKKTMKDVSRGKFSLDKFTSAKETMAGAIKASVDSPMGIISNYYASILVGSKDVDERIKMIGSVTKEDIVNVSRKIEFHTVFILEGDNEEDNDK